MLGLKIICLLSVLSLGQTQFFSNLNQVAFQTFNEFGNIFNPNQQLQGSQEYYPTQSQNRFYLSQQNCEGIFSYQQDQNEVFGLIRISNPDRIRNFLKVELSLAAQLSNVRWSFFLTVLVDLEKFNIFINNFFRKICEKESRIRSWGSQIIVFSNNWYLWYLIKQIIV